MLLKGKCSGKYSDPKLINETTDNKQKEICDLRRSFVVIRIDLEKSWVGNGGKKGKEQRRYKISVQECLGKFHL
jgi:hypothetical protein